ncbi:MAG: ABC transporter ATP-binding protein [Prevotella sp.]|nr:ABC transporter ATP-binding protein [Prevotella sp.]
MKLIEKLHNPESKYTIRQIVRWLWRVLRGNRTQALFNASIGMLGVVCSLLMVWAMQRTIDMATGVVSGSIYWGVALMGTVILAEFALGISRVWIKNILGVKAQNLMQQQMLDRLLRAEWQSKDTHHSGDVINRLEQDVQTVVTFITETLPNTLSTMALFLGAFFYLFQMDVWLALITVGILPLFILVSRIYVAQMRKYTRRVRNSDSQVQSLLTETVQHRMLIKTLEAGDQMVDRLGDTQSELRYHVRQRTKFSIASNLFVNGGFSLGYLIAFLWGAVRLSARTITFGQMTAFLQLVYRIQGPARDLTRLAPAFVSVFTSAERLMELEEAPQEQQGKGIEMATPCGVKFNDVTYGYEDSTVPVINHLSFDFRPGTCTAILGETGAGKTTLVRLILALIRPKAGQVNIYDQGKAEEISPLHRCNFVYVPQGNTLLSGTIRENLLIARPDATDDDLWRVLHLVCSDFVADLPQGLDTICTEAGGGLSEGQAQRIAIARALLRGRSIMLFDEATSALDPDTERQLLQNILSDKQKTVIFITHRPAVVDYCDQVLRVE